MNRSKLWGIVSLVVVLSLPLLLIVNGAQAGENHTIYMPLVVRVADDITATPSPTATAIATSTSTPSPSQTPTQTPTATATQVESWAITYAIVWQDAQWQIVHRSNTGVNTQTSAGVNHGKFDSAWVIPTDNDYLLVTLNTTAPYHNVVTYQSFTTGQTVTTSLWTAYEAIYSDGQFFAVRNPYGGIDLGEVHGDGSVTTEHIGFDPDLQTWQLQAGKLLALKVVSAGHNQQSRVRAYGTFEQFGNGTYNVFTNTYWLTDTTGLAAPQLDVTSQKESLSPNGSLLYYYWLKDVGDPNGQSECRIASIDSALTVTHVVDSGGSYSECPGSKPLWYGEDNLYIKGYPYSAWNIPGDTWNHSLPDLGDDYTSFSYAQTDPTNSWILYFLPTMGSWAAFVPGVNSMLHLEMWGGVALHRVMIALPNP